MNRDDIWGDPVNPPGPFKGGDSPASDIAKLLAFSLSAVFVVAGITLLIYLLWGSVEWITSGGDKENLTKARSKITNALVGMFILVTVLVIWIFIMNTFGLMEISGKNIKFELPTINN